MARDGLSFHDGGGARAVHTDAAVKRGAHARQRVAIVALVLLTLIAPHFIGGIHAWATAIIAGLAAATLCVTLWATRSHLPPFREPVVIALFTPIVVTALHALPLPPPIAAVVAADAHANAVEIARHLGLATRGWVAFSLDPAGTWERLLFAVAIFASFSSARLLALASHANAIAASVAGSSVLVALAHLGHQLAGAKRVYGLYAPDFRQAVGPLLNPNNFAGFMALGVPACLGLGLCKRGAERWAWFVGGGVLAATGLLAGSRAGLVVLVGGPILFGLAYWTRRLLRRSAGSKRRAHTIGIGRSSSIEAALLIIAMLATGFGLAELAADDFLDTNYADLTKFELFATELRTLQGNVRTAMVGAGRGAFRAAVSPVVHEPIRVMHAECLPLQYAIEFGVPLAALFILTAALRLGFGFISWRSPVQLGAAVGVSVLGLQNLVDFSLELTGIAVPAAVAFGVCLPVSTRNAKRLLHHAENERSSRVAVLNLVGVGAVLSVLICILVSLPAARQDILLVERKLGEYARTANHEAFWSLFRDVAFGHAADPSIALLAALEKTIEDAPDAPFWLNRSMRLSPGSAHPHLWAAHWLASRGRWAQAENELKSAADIDPNAFLSEVCSWMRTEPNLDFLLRVAPTNGAARRETMNRAAMCLSGTHPAVSDQIDDLLLQEAPRHLPAQLRAGQRAFAQRHYDDVVQRMRQIRQHEPNSAAAFALEAAAISALGDAPAAAALLTSALGRTDSDRTLLMALATAEAKAGNANGMRDAIALLRAESAGKVKSLAQVMAHLSTCEATLGNNARALNAMLEAHRLSEAPRYLAAAADLALKLGQTDFVLRAWNQLCESQAQTYCTRRDRLQEQMAEGMLVP